MNLTRRSFIKKSSYSAAAVTILGTGVGLAEGESQSNVLVKWHLWIYTTTGETEGLNFLGPPNLDDDEVLENMLVNPESIGGLNFVASQGVIGDTKTFLGPQFSEWWEFISVDYPPGTTGAVVDREPVVEDGVVTGTIYTIRFPIGTIVKAKQRFDEKP